MLHHNLRFSLSWITTPQTATSGPDTSSWKLLTDGLIKPPISIVQTLEPHKATLVVNYTRFYRRYRCVNSFRTEGDGWMLSGTTYRWRRTAITFRQPLSAGDAPWRQGSSASCQRHSFMNVGAITPQLIIKRTHFGLWYVSITNALCSH